jgi:hypothetical protein
VLGTAYVIVVLFTFFFKQKTAYEINVGDWSSDVCSSDLWTGEWNVDWRKREDWRVD